MMENKNKKRFQMKRLNVLTVVNQIVPVKRFSV